MHTILLKTASATLLVTGLAASAPAESVPVLVRTTLETAVAKYAIIEAPDSDIEPTDSVTAAIDVQQLPLIPNEPQAVMRSILEEFAASQSRPLNMLSVLDARLEPGIELSVEKMTKDLSIPQQRLGAIINFDHLKVESGMLESRVYVPVGLGPFPVILYIHGGGWVTGNLDRADAAARALALDTNAVVVSIDYRKAPEHKFPAAHMDCLGAYQWILANTHHLRGDRTKVAVAGEGAGGTMALAISLMAKERGLPLPVHQVLIHPVSDLTDFNKPSYREFAEARPLSREEMMWFSEQLLNNSDEARDPRVSPALAPTDKLRGLPPTTILNAKIDPLRSDGDRLRSALLVARVPTHHLVYDGVTHGFFGMGALLAQAQYASAQAASDLNASFGRTVPGSM